MSTAIRIRRRFLPVFLEGIYIYTLFFLRLQIYYAKKNSHVHIINKRIIRTLIGVPCDRRARTVQDTRIINRPQIVVCFLFIGLSELELFFRSSGRQRNASTSIYICVCWNKKPTPLVYNKKKLPLKRRENDSFFCSGEVFKKAELPRRRGLVQLARRRPRDLSFCVRLYEGVVTDRNSGAGKTHDFTMHRSRR